MKRRLILIAAAGLALAGCNQAAEARENHVRAPAPTVTANERGGLKTAIFAGGCFWGIEGIFSHVKGVKSAVSGYHGGTRRQASYRIVTSGVTDHAESVKVVYDPKVVSYDELVRIFFSVGADPTLRNRQGPDVGSHYRAALVPMNGEQRKVAAAYLRQMERSGVWSRPIMTRIESYRAFYPAEGYHQDFMAKNPNHGYIRRWDAPKVRALREFYPEHFRATFKRG
ncbi:peptide-methionine (S)-S-oxide reductase MsrA [Parerythrobacter jejuensis]|uniref:Peptide methionine sulfoxide reductase MsrA n=1 Tax=Parerythrobacter jejuensis TaxID=795812 RepID=A0A845ALA4_9SPHN|nr:peptide-methionine (S)-S-oxide reductase MsrA [Parerythrobacter jejuensis]MXP31040.1 peptide-methionine (S)-S-oxide reductase MsrA [Parerythrobacter jejuensis]MXP33800.1 peptide-methionine (S)-S-oxide reductase MsrA [Parerythrobacter jejuensis]